MDLDEWEVLLDDGLLDHYNHEDPGKRKIFSSVRKSDAKTTTTTTTVFNMNYFICPSPDSGKIIQTPNQQHVPVPIQLDTKKLVKDPDDEKAREVIKGPEEADQETVSQVFFKKMKENNEFVDMKMDSPKSGNKGIIMSPLGFDSVGKFQSDGKEDDADQGKMKMNSPRINTKSKKKSNNVMDCDDDNNNNKNGGLNLWKLSSTGIGAICSFGIAAATICIIFVGNNQRNNKQYHHNQKLRFQVYTDDKRIKQVVRQATKLNEAISAGRVVPLTRAQITFGGYYDGL